jgi:DNA-binding SARP family transcriptional activator/class 3 adenylate cyclase/predicted ATPase
MRVPGAWRAWMSRLTIQVLGGLNIQRVGTDARIDLPTRKSKAILAYLALSPGMLRSREHLAATFWDRSAEEQARASLRQTLSSLRRTLSTLISTDSASVWLHPQAVEVDALQFERLAGDRSPESLDKAVALCQGELLAGFSLREEPFEQWMSAERRRFHELAVQVFSMLVDHYAGAERPDRAIAIAEKLLALDPLLESAHRSLIRLYLRSGRREAALRQFQECARILNQELGIAPAEETRQLAAEAGREPGGHMVAESTRVPSMAQRSGEPMSVTLVADDREGETSPPLPAERKQLTVLCGRIRELIDSSDPEAALERDPMLAAMIDAVRRFGGTISQVRDDGVTALFGAPLAHEDHAVRACYAALAMREAITSRAQRSLDLRIGIHSGEAVVRTIGRESARHYDAVGPVSRLAGHIDAALAPGEIGLTADAARRAEGFVELSRLKAKRLEDVAEPVELFALRAKAVLRLRWDARSTRELTHFVGRETESARLAELLERAARGSGQVAAIIGEPGVGKSRLVHEFIGSRPAADWTVLETGTTGHDTEATYLPIANLLRTWFRIGERDTQAEAAGKLRSGVTTLDGALAPMLPPLAALLDLLPEDQRWSALNPQQRRQRTLEAVTTLLMRESETRPLILVVEDLHWCDAGTQAVLDHLVDRVAGSRVLLLLTQRPEYRHEWFAKSYFSQLRLEPLAKENADRLLRTLLGDDRQLVDLRKQLIEHTEGTPLFLEESVRALADADMLIGGPGAYRAARPIEISQVPSTVHAVIAARIDRLPPMQKSLLQTAAVIGKDVPAELLQPIAGLDAEPLNELLAELQAAEFLYQSRLLPAPEYTFKHALTHQVAYESLLKGRRRALHVQLLDVSEVLYADRLDEHVERLAHHALTGEQWSKAVHYLYRSANKAIQRSAHQQAIQYLNKGLEIIEAQPASPQRLRQELDYRKAMGVTMMAARGWAAKEVLDAYTRARALCEELGDRREMFIALRGEGQYRMIRGESRIARALGDRCIELAAGSKDIGVHIESHHLFWTNGFFMGEYADADLHCAKGISLYERGRDHALTYVYSGHDPGVCCRCFSALIQCLSGYPDRSLDLCKQALDLAQQLDHPLTTALAQWAYSLAHILRREPGPALTWAEREIAVGEQYLLPLLVSQGSFQVGWALAELGDLDEGIARMRDGLTAISATGAEMGLPYYVALLGEALGKAGTPDAGLREVDRALTIANRHGANFQLSEILRLKGDLLATLSKPRLGEAKACYRQAIEVADKQGAKLPKLRAATSFARLLAGKGEPVQARTLLRPRYDAISEGLDLADLKAAAALLAELGDR